MNPVPKQLLIAFVEGLKGFECITKGQKNRTLICHINERLPLFDIHDKRAASQIGLDHLWP